MSESGDVVMTTVLFILVVVDIVGNTLVCLIIKRNRDMRTPINYLLLNLAVADVLYAAFIAPTVTFTLTFIHHPDGTTGTILCKILTGGGVGWIAAVSSIITPDVIAVERYHAVLNPFGNKWKLTKATLKVVIPACWIFAIIFNIPQFLVKDITMIKDRNFCLLLWSKEWMAMAYSMAWFAVVIISLLLMAILYFRVVYTLWFKRNDDNQLTYQQKGVIRVRKRVTLMVAIVTAIFGICWGSSAVVYLLLYVASFNIGPVPIAVVNTMVLFNSAVNPFVYALLNQQFREKMKEILCCTGSSAPRVYPMPDPLDIRLADNINLPSHRAAPISSK